MQRTIKALFPALLSLTIALSVSAAQITTDFLTNIASGGCDWQMINIARSGADDNFDAYINAQHENVDTRYAEGGVFSKTPTDTQRTVLALAAAGANVRAFGEYMGKPIDLLAEATYNMVTETLDPSGINSAVYGLLALDCVKAEIPQDAKFTRKNFIDTLISYKLADGGFTWWGDTYDADMTAMAIQALSPYYSDETVKGVIDGALTLLSENQLQSGDYASWGTPNPESTAQVLIALCAMGIDYKTDARFIKDGNNLLEAIEKYRLPDGTFCHEAGGASNSYATVQATSAVVAAARFDCGKTSLYDYSDVYAWNAAMSAESGAVSVYSDKAQSALLASASYDDGTLEDLDFLPVTLTKGKNSFSTRKGEYYMLFDLNLAPLTRRTAEE